MKMKIPENKKVIIVILAILGIISILAWVRRGENSSELIDFQIGHEDNGSEEESDITRESLPIWHMDGEFELPSVGAAGFSALNHAVYSDPQGEVNGDIESGTPFTIDNVAGSWVKIEYEDRTGWLPQNAVLINLPDVIPSIVYDHTNSYASRFKSSYYELPGITGEPINPMIDFNERLGEETFIVPVLYQTAMKIFEAQKLALQHNETLIIYEAYRPRSLQIEINDVLRTLSEDNDEVREGLTRMPWNMTWFISQNISNHQRGAAIDVSLAEIETISEKVIGDFVTFSIEEYTEYTMHTPIHELSADSVVFTRPIASSEQEEWKELEVNPEMTEASLKLQEYLVEAGLTPLASEWWHFNDNQVLEEMGEESGEGDFLINETFNAPPLYMAD